MYKTQSTTQIYNLHNELVLKDLTEIIVMYCIVLSMKGTICWHIYADSQSFSKEML